MPLEMNSIEQGALFNPGNEMTDGTDNAAIAQSSMH